MLQKKFAICIVLTVGLTFAAVLFAQSGKTTSDGVYTQAQADKGHDLYTQQCATCHGAQMEGSGQNPPLKGDAFLSNWSGQTLGDLYTTIKTTMPATKPGSLESGQVAQLIAYILSTNSYPAGPVELPDSTDGLKAIQIAAPAKSGQ